MELTRRQMSGDTLWPRLLSRYWKNVRSSGLESLVKSSVEDSNAGTIAIVRSNR